MQYIAKNEDENNFGIFKRNGSKAQFTIGVKLRRVIKDLRLVY